MSGTSAPRRSDWRPVPTFSISGVTFPPLLTNSLRPDQPAISACRSASAAHRTRPHGPRLRAYQEGGVERPGLDEEREDLDRALRRLAVAQVHAEDAPVLPVRRAR